MTAPDDYMDLAGWEMRVVERAIQTARRCGSWRGYLEALDATLDFAGIR